VRFLCYNYTIQLTSIHKFFGGEVKSPPWLLPLVANHCEIVFGCKWLAYQASKLWLYWYLITIPFIVILYSNQLVLLHHWILSKLPAFDLPFSYLVLPIFPSHREKWRDFPWQQGIYWIHIMQWQPKSCNISSRPNSHQYDLWYV